MTTETESLSIKLTNIFLALTRSIYGKEDRSEIDLYPPNFDEMAEKHIESKFAFAEKAKLKLAEATGVKDCSIQNQLPVGVFEGKVSNKTRIFTGGKSALDLWALSAKGAGRTRCQLCCR